MPHSKNHKTSSCAKLKALFEKYDLVDIWQYQHPLEKDFTYFLASHQVHTRIDFILLSSALVQHVFSSEIGVQFWSDHAWLSCVLQDPLCSPRVRADWILNSSLLAKDSVKADITTEIKNFFFDNSNCGVSSQMTWDAFKAVLRKKFISLSSFYKKQQEHLRIQLLDRIKTLEQIHKRTCSKKIYKQLLQERKT